MNSKTGTDDIAEPDSPADDEAPAPEEATAAEDADGAQGMEDTEDAQDASEAGDGEDGGADADPEVRAAELEVQVAELSDRLLRAAAETENVRKRGLKDRDDARKYATARFAEDVLAVADNLARALETVTDEARREDSGKALIEGVELTMRELNTVLERHGIKEIDAHGTRFDPNLHQAMFEIETAEAEPGTVMQVLRTGYTIHDRLLRAAMVGVAKAPDGNQAES